MDPQCVSHTHTSMSNNKAIISAVLGHFHTHEGTAFDMRLAFQQVAPNISPERRFQQVPSAELSCQDKLLHLSLMIVASLRKSM